MFVHKLLNLRVLSLCLIITLLLTSVGAIAAEITVSSDSAILMEVTTGEVLFEKNADRQRPPASITKIMTLLLIMEALDSGKIKLDDVVVASRNAAEKGGSQIWLEVGEEMTVEDLLKSIAIVSANDSATAMAEFVAGSEYAFVEMMNDKAKELGMSNTIYVNPTGLPPSSSGGPENLTTARDVAIVSRELLKYSQVHKWLSTWIDYVRDGKNILVNTNRLVRFYEGCDGIKTGYTEEAKHCLAATAIRNGVRVIAVVMGAPTSNDRFDDCRKLLDYGLGYYSSIAVAKKDELLGEAKVFRGVAEKVGVVAAEDLNVVVPRREDPALEKRIVFNDKITAPIKKGEPLGELIVERNGKEVGRVDLVAATDVPKGNIFNIFAQITKKTLLKLFGGKE